MGRQDSLARAGEAAAAGGSGVPRMTMADRVYEDIKERILDQTLRPGERLTIESLARHVATSSSPIREALTRLEKERLVVCRIYAGYSVAPAPDPDYLRGLLEFRALVEGHCARIGAPRRLPDVLATLEESYSQMARTKRLGTRYREYRRFVEADTRFHQAIVQSSGNPATIAVYADLNAVFLQSRLYANRASDPGRTPQVHAEHAAILQAFRDGDGAAAEAAIRSHLDGGRRRLLDKAANGTHAAAAANATARGD